MAHKNIRTVADIGERGLLRAIARRLDGTTFGRPGTKTVSPGGRGRGSVGGGVVVGVGDDAAVLSVRGDVVVTTDLLVEDVDFAWRWASFADVGHKAAAVNLSDLAAMGAEPRGLLLSLALRSGDAVRDVLALISTVHRVGLQYGAPLIGGDLSATAGPLVVSVTALGEAAPNRVLRRYAARVGDRLLVSGALGGAAVALRAFMQGALVPPLVARRQLRPEPKIALGRFLARQAGVRSCADISDGIAGDALHLVPRGLGVEIDPLLLPIDPAVRRLAAKLGLSAQHLALCGGEDFELVLAADPRAVSRILQGAARLGCPLTPIGVVRRGRGLRLLRARVKGLEAFAHFH